MEVVAAGAFIASSRAFCTVIQKFSTWFRVLIVAYPSFLSRDTIFAPIVMVETTDLRFFILNSNVITTIASIGLFIVHIFRSDRTI